MRNESRSENSQIFQLHYLFQIRVAGDIFVSEENIKENLPDFQDYLNNTCTMWVIFYYDWYNPSIQAF